MSKSNSKTDTKHSHSGRKRSSTTQLVDTTSTKKQCVSLQPPVEFEMFVPDTRTYEEAEKIRRKEKEKQEAELKKQEDLKIQKLVALKADLKIISDSIKNHPGVKENRPDDLKDDQIFCGLCRPGRLSQMSAVWWVQFSKPVTGKAFRLAIGAYEKDDGKFFLDYAGFDVNGDHFSKIDESEPEDGCVIWKKC